MIITTTPTIQGRHISEYKGLVHGQVINGINALKDFEAGIRNVIGGRARGYEGELNKSRLDVLGSMEEQARTVGADAIVGIRLDYEYLEGMLLVTGTGTAVSLAPDEQA